MVSSVNSKYATASSDARLEPSVIPRSFHGAADPLPQRKSICLLSFSLIRRDARVLRQIEYLSKHYQVTVIGYGNVEDLNGRRSDVHWLPIPTQDETMGMVIRDRILSKLPDRYSARAIEYWYWSVKSRRKALRLATA